MSETNREERLQIMLTEDELRMRRRLALQPAHAEPRLGGAGAATRGLAAEGFLRSDERMKSKDFGVVESTGSRARATLAPAPREGGAGGPAPLCSRARRLPMQRALSVSRMTGNRSTFPRVVPGRGPRGRPGREQPGARLHGHQAVGLWHLGADPARPRPPDQGRPGTRTPTSRCSSRSRFFAKEAEHVEGFAKEMAVVTHHRLKTIDGKLERRSRGRSSRSR